MASSTEILEREKDCLRVSNSFSGINKDGTVVLQEGLTFPTTNDHFSKESLRKRTALLAQERSKKRKVFVKKFRKEWMDEPIFRGWLHPIPTNKERCWCAVCNVVLLCGHSELEKHASGKKHSDLMEQLKTGVLVNQDTCYNVFSVKQENTTDNLTHNDPLDFQEEILEVPVDSSDISPPVVFHLDSDGRLIELPVEDYEKLSNLVNKDTDSDKMTTVGLPKNNNTSSNSISKNNTIGVNRTNSNQPVRIVPAKSKILNPKSQQLLLRNKTTQGSSSVGPAASAMQTTGGNLSNMSHLLMTDTEDDEFDDFDDDEDDDDDLADSKQLIKEMKAEVLYQEKKMAADKRSKSEKIDYSTDNKIKGTDDEIMKNIAERELEVKLQHLEERRRQRFNIYKLKLQEMDARVKCAEAELNRKEELHKLQLRHLQIQLEKEGETFE